MALSREFLLNLYNTVLTIRTFESECIPLYKQGFIKGYFHPYFGEEAVAAGICAALNPQDYITSTHRGHGHSIARGADLGKMAAELMGKETGYCMGLGGSMHIADITAGNLGANGIVGGGISIGVGAALGARIRGENRVCAIFFSDGASNNGVFPEALNIAAVYSLPVIFVCENNHYAVSTPVEKSCRSRDLISIAKGYSVDCCIADGNDATAVYEAGTAAADMCRNGKGPFMIEAKTYRYGGHHVNDAGAYMPKERLEQFKLRDPVDIAKSNAVNIGKATEAETSAIEITVKNRVSKAIEYAMAGKEMAVDKFIKLIESY
jgi:pyruvate dehydrogenase E1 component alpha subunit